MHVPRAARLSLLALVLLLAGCTSSTGPHPLTDDEAQRLSLARFSMYDAGFVDLAMTVPIDGQTLQLDGRADLVAHEAYAGVTTNDSPPRHALLQWTLTNKAIAETQDAGLPAQPPTTGWQAAAMVPGDPLDNALLLTLNLGADRPENPLLLQQSPARWLRSDTVDGTDVDVFEVPASGGSRTVVRYWVDEDGTLHRVDADTGRPNPLVIDLHPSDDTDAIPLIEALRSK
jgi:hypothetical protein